MHERTVLFYPEAMAADTEVLANKVVGGKKALGVASRFEPAHDQLELACWLMCILYTFVQSSVLTMFHFLAEPMWLSISASLGG